MVFVDYNPGVAVYYDKAKPTTERILTEVELNPAFAGLANGYVYLQHKIWEPKQLILQVDKPRVPYLTKSNRSEDIEFGPVFQEDYAVLTVTAFGSNEHELISGAKLLVKPDRPTWDGSVNYQNPLKEDVWVTTGADGNASLVFTPGQSYGYYLAPASSIAGDTVTLPEPVDVDKPGTGSRKPITSGCTR